MVYSNKNYFTSDVSGKPKTRDQFKYNKISTFDIIIANFDCIENESGSIAEVLLNIDLVMFLNLDHEIIENIIDQSCHKLTISDLCCQENNHFQSVKSYVHNETSYYIKYKARRRSILFSWLLVLFLVESKENIFNYNKYLSTI